MNENNNNNIDILVVDDDDDEDDEQDSNKVEDDQADNENHENENHDHDDDSYDYIFGYGSIMNKSTHSAWLLQQKDILPGRRANLIQQNMMNDSSTSTSPPFVFRRAWNFRSSTGFTALGIKVVTAMECEAATTTTTTTTAEDTSHHSDNNVNSSSSSMSCMNGVLFRIPHSVLADFDRREVGYGRVALQRNQIQLLSSSSSESTSEFDLSCNNVRIWIYIPQPTHTATADPDHPILQSYVDTVLQGCLEWGGEDMCRQFITSTQDWSRSYYLNDIPHSRRPWLYRSQDYQVMDALLHEYSHITHVHQARRHPEDFAAHRVATEQAQAAALLLHSSGKDTLRGAWSLPQRNSVFVGRTKELQEIHDRLLQQQQQHSTSSSSSSSSSSKTTSSNSTNVGSTTIATLQVAGMGGVGKTQLVAEYCHLHVHEYYGLVLWLRASSAESVAAGYRQFMADCILQTTSSASSPTSAASAATASSQSSNSTTAAIAVTDEIKEMDDTDTVIAEVKARLFRSKVPWLLVFDNLEDFQLLPKFVPNGGTMKGHHVIVTTRLLHAHENRQQAGATAINQPSEQELQYDTMILQCFRPEESVQLLCRAGLADMPSGSSSSGRIVQRKHHEQQAARDLAERLGHLPLALGMAAAYMQQCDVDCCEYLTRYISASSSSSSSNRSNGSDHRGSNGGSGGGGSRKKKSHQGLNVLGHEAVSSSLSLSLQVIQKENAMAWEMLRLLSWLGPDQLTKKLVRSLLLAKRRQHGEEKQQLEACSQKHVCDCDSQAKRVLSSSFIIIGAGIVLAWPAWPLRHRPTWQTGVIFGLASLSASLTTLMVAQSVRPRPPPPPPRSLSSSSLEGSLSNQQAMMLSRNQSFAGDVYQQTDLIWKLLKSFSLLQVKGGKASMHRLLGQFLRLSQSDDNDDDDNAHFNLHVCFRAILDIWSFKPELIETWSESTLLLEHVKTLVAHTIKHNIYQVEIAILAQEAGVFSAMVLNRFEEAQDAIEQSLRILDAMPKQSVSFRSTAANLDQDEARGRALHELGRVLRYEGKFPEAEQALSKALEIRNRLAAKRAHEATMADALPDVASTLHELGVLEVKKHNLDNATTFLHQALELRRRSAILESSSSPLSLPGIALASIEADCASTLHQMAAVEVARKPPALDKAETLLVRPGA
jgi:tetratricopeptide (TPR) repeat protein